MLPLLTLLLITSFVPERPTRAPRYDSPAAVPEPATLALLGSGIGAIAIAVNRKRTRR